MDELCSCWCWCKSRGEEDDDVVRRRDDADGLLLVADDHWISIDSESVEDTWS